MAQETTEMEQVKLEVEESLINAYGNTITIRSPGTISQDAWGSPVASGQTDVVTIGVNDNYLVARMQLVSAGRLKEGESIVIIKAGETVDEEYTIIIEGVEYNIISVEDLKAADVVIAKILIVASK